MCLDILGPQRLNAVQCSISLFWKRRWGAKRNKDDNRTGRLYSTHFKGWLHGPCGLLIGFCVQQRKLDPLCSVTFPPQHTAPPSLPSADTHTNPETDNFGSHNMAASPLIGLHLL